jgi:hypothetical protein
VQDVTKWLIPSGAGVALIKWVADLCAHEPTRFRLSEILRQDFVGEKYRLLVDALLEWLARRWGPPWSIRYFVCTRIFDAPLARILYGFAWSVGMASNQP